MGEGGGPRPHRPNGSLSSYRNASSGRALPASPRCREAGRLRRNPPNSGARRYGEGGDPQYRNTPNSGRTFTEKSGSSVRS